jgi:hypothetical protein
VVNLACFGSKVGAILANGSSSNGKKPTIRLGWISE